MDVPVVAPAELYELMIHPTDEAYRRWWPGTHLAFHVVRRDPSMSPIGDVVWMDERVGSRRLRFAEIITFDELLARAEWHAQVAEKQAESVDDDDDILGFEVDENGVILEDDWPI